MNPAQHSRFWTWTTFRFDEVDMKRIIRRRIVIETTETWSMTIKSDSARGMEASAPVLPGDAQSEANLSAEDAPLFTDVPVDLPHHGNPRTPQYRRKIDKKRKLR